MRSRRGVVTTIYNEELISNYQFNLQCLILKTDKNFDKLKNWKLCYCLNAKVQQDGSNGVIMNEDDPIHPIFTHHISCVYLEANNSAVIFNCPRM